MLDAFRSDDPGDDGPAPSWVVDFENWIAAALDAGRISDLLDYRVLAPHVQHNHPTEEHLLPLFVALGAAGLDASVSYVHASHTYGILAMDAYLFTATAVPAVPAGRVASALE